MTREPNDADRWLLVRLPARDLIEEKLPTPQKWGWRYKGPADDPCGPSTDANPAENIVTWASSLLDLEALGWVWRGTRSSDFRTGWGLTPAGTREHYLLIKAGQRERWERNQEWWGELADAMGAMLTATPAATQPDTPAK